MLQLRVWKGSLPPVPSQVRDPHKPRTRKRKLSEGSGEELAKKIAIENEGTKQNTVSSITVFPGLPLVYPLLLSYNSTIILQLQQLGVADIARDIAKEHRLAGRLSLFRQNWEEICNDHWILEAIQGYHIEWLSDPCQRHRPACPHFSMEETESLETEVGQMLLKGAISPVETGMDRDGFLSSIFLIPKKDGGHRPIINLKRLFYMRLIYMRVQATNKMPVKCCWITSPVVSDMTVSSA